MLGESLHVLTCLNTKTIQTWTLGHTTLRLLHGTIGYNAFDIPRNNQFRLYMHVVAFSHIEKFSCVFGFSETFS